MHRPSAVQRLRQSAPHLDSIVSIAPAQATKRAREPDKKRSGDAMRVVAAATDLSGDALRAVSWYKCEPLPAFAFKTAEQLVSDGRTDAVLRYLVSLETGATG